MSKVRRAGRDGGMFMARRLLGTRRSDRASVDGSGIETLLIVAAVATALYLGRGIAIPIAIAILISFSLGPPVSWLHRRHLGRIPAIIAVVTPVLLVLAAFAYLVTTEVGKLAVNIPAYQTNIESKINGVASALPSRDMLDRGTAFLRGLSKRQSAPVPVRGSRGREVLPAPPTDAKPIAVEIQTPDPTPVDIARAVVGPLIEPVSDTALVLLFVVFFLAEKETLRDRVIRLAGVRDLHRTTMLMDEAGTRVSRYLLLQTLVNTGFGVTLTLALWALGLPNAALWGGLAAVLRFIPYLGIAASAILPLALAFAVDPGWEMLFWTAGIFLSLELLTGNVLEPWLYGSSTGLSAVALVLSAIVWTWLWGTIGLLLATPLTVCIAVIGRYVPQLAFLDILLGNQAPLKPEEAFYQRLLAGHADEATSQAEDFVKARSIPAFLSEVALRALLLAERDRLRGELDSDHVIQVADGVKAVVASLAAERKAQAKPGGKGKKAGMAAPVETEVVICAAGRSALDEAAAALLAVLLRKDGLMVVTLPYASAIEVALPGIDLQRIKTICLSYLDPEAVPHARYLARRFRRRIGSDICLIAAFWGMDQDAGRIEHARAETRADRVVLSLETAADTIERGVSAEGLPALSDEPELTELAQRISEVIGAVR
jgi:predicted PurR-regulated permease PerM